MHSDVMHGIIAVLTSIKKQEMGVEQKQMKMSLTAPIIPLANNGHCPPGAPHG